MYDRPIYFFIYYLLSKKYRDIIIAISLSNSKLYIRRNIDGYIHWKLFTEYQFDK